MRGLLADANIEGHIGRLLARFETDAWHELWAGLSLATASFASLSLPRNISDMDLWRICQARELVLITANRNADGPDSLEASIRAFNTPDCLPVVTIADADRILADGAYAEKVAEQLIEYLYDIENYRGAGRLYVP